MVRGSPQRFHSARVRQTSARASSLLRKLTCIRHPGSIIKASISSTATVGRGLGMIRTLSNAFASQMLELEHQGADLDQRKRVFSTSSLMMAAIDGDITNGKVELGQSAGLVDSIEDAGELVGRIAREYLEAIGRLPAVASA